MSTRRNFAITLVTLGITGALTGCPGPKGPTPPPKIDAPVFVEEVNKELVGQLREINAAGWTQSTNITVDTTYLNARATDRILEFYSRKAGEAKAYDNDKLDASAARSLMLIKLGVSAPAPADATKRAELAGLSTELEAMYGEGKYCPQGKSVLAFGKDENGCKNLDTLGEIIATSRNYDELTEAWAGWHSIAKPMRPKYQRFAELANEGARELGFEDLGVLWRSRYDMPAADFEKEAARLYDQVRPLYQGLHCYARGRLAKKYGAEKVAAGKPIPAHLFGNMWAQQWNRIYDDLLKPYPQASIETADRELQKQAWDAVRMTKSAESFYTSIGFPALPQTFWERSMLTRPRDREVVCHASASDMDDKDDVRIKMCMRPIEEDLFTIYHELGHVYYFIWYKDQPALFQDGAHDGFHEAIGDAVNLSVTPGVPAPDRPGERGQTFAGSRHQRADEDGARQDRLPALRQTHRRMALGVCSTAASSPATTTRRGGSCARSTRVSRLPWRAAKRTSIRARSTTSRATRRTRVISCRSSCSSSSTRRCATQRGSRARCTSARSSAARKRARNTPP